MTADLIARLEATSGGNSTLSWEIAEFLGWTTFWCGHMFYVPPGEVAEKIKREPMSVSINDLPDGTTLEPPHYTESLDAAMTLVPK